MNFVRKFWKEWQWWILAGIIILGLGLGLRLYRLTLLPVFVDEAIYIRWAQVMGAEPTLRFLPLSDGKQPLFMWILMFYVRRLSDPLFAGRILSVVSGIGTMLGIFAVSFLLFKNKLVSLIAVVLYALSPFTLFFDRLALVDSMLAAFGIWILFFGILTAQTLRLDVAMITGFMLGGAFLTKSPAIFFVLLLPAVGVFVRKPRDLIKLALLLLVAYGIGCAMYNILRLGPNFNLIKSRNQDYVLPISHLWTNFKDPLIPHIKDVFLYWLPKMGPWPIMVLAAIGLAATAHKKYWKKVLILGLWFLVPIFIQAEYAKVFTARYVLFTLPPIYIFAALSILNRNKIYVVFSSLFIILFVAMSGIFDWYLFTNPAGANLPRGERSGYLEEWTAGDGIREVADYIKDQGPPVKDQKIVVGTEGYFGTLPDGLEMYLNNVPGTVVIGVGLGLKEIPTSLLESKAAGNKTYLVINKSRFEEDPDKLGLRLIAVYPKALRPPGDREYLLKGPQEALLFFELK